ncbi:UDP-glucuronate 4-epimerase 1 [Amborella trichopoda]|uniref:UDP-glucuronate 4-epimerase n=1 Tax=Amborella trichopoda TaxID=13333 RepID=U5D2E2_AMBTC|nr:UDP-glucuronate 4-epimerase 1 [Amborella trichopoda]XP_011626493.1 UDP-glucuronate 4-epimerase 1 [Amborella trichopoda]XP_020528354.1 UDP-glucuronate 4-epimerase 1 [Amborella trichopoda]ERN14513.1 hypothetical protein AMTR_s00038p00035160 [Amborella trichopoda]|eukprot:XP_006853046.1 UDP-glucuronate 4-epimerase 1 [Amborella trichopoda]
MPSSLQDSFPSTPGKVKIDRSHYNLSRQINRWLSSSATLVFWSLFLLALTASFACLKTSFTVPQSHARGATTAAASWGGPAWEKQLRRSCETRRANAQVVLVTGAAGFIGTHVSLALKKRGDGVLGLDNFNDYYDPSLKRARQSLLARHGIFVAEGDINDGALLSKLLDFVPFTHVMHLAAQAGVRYAMENPNSYVHSNVAGLVSLLEACRKANPQPAIVWASSSSVYGLNSEAPFCEADRTDRPASLYAATKKAGEAITHAYNHIYGLSVTGLRFFTVYGPWGRPDMAYFAFTRNILQGKAITIYRARGGAELARDFTYVDDVVRGCVAALDTAQPSTGSGGRKRGSAQYRIYNLGNTTPLSVPQLVSILERHLRVKATRNVVEMPGNGDVPFTHANVTMARLELGYKPTTDLQAGLKKFVKWYLNYYGYEHNGKGKI